MENYIFEVNPEGKEFPDGIKDGGGIRIDRYLASVFPRPISRSHIKRLMDEGKVLVNGAAVKAHHKVRQGERIEVIFEEIAAKGVEAEDIRLDIIYEDEDIIVINKPAGMTVHPGAGVRSGTVANAMLHHCKNLSTVYEARPGIVHRLDKDTSGVMVIAKNNESHMVLAGQFKERLIKKNYIALVRGIVELDEGVVDMPIGRHPRQRQKMAIRYDSEKNAVTEYKVLKRFGNFTAVFLNLKTGRTHQIRVHMAYLGHPVLGDAKYGANGNFPRQALHSYLLRLCHPKTGKVMEFRAELPEDMKKMIGFNSGGSIPGQFRGHIT